eukprot:gene16306-biopygen23261
MRRRRRRTRHSAAPQAPLKEKNAVLQASQRHDTVSRRGQGVVAAKKMRGGTSQKNDSYSADNAYKGGNEHRTLATWRRRRQKLMKTCKRGTAARGRKGQMSFPWVCAAPLWGCRRETPPPLVQGYWPPAQSGRTGVNIAGNSRDFHRWWIDPQEPTGPNFPFTLPKWQLLPRMVGIGFVWGGGHAFTRFFKIVFVSTLGRPPCRSTAPPPPPARRAGRGWGCRGRGPQGHAGDEPHQEEGETAVGAGRAQSTRSIVAKWVRAGHASLSNRDKLQGRASKRPGRRAGAGTMVAGATKMMHRAQWNRKGFNSHFPVKGETAEDASGTRPFLQVASCGTRPRRSSQQQNYRSTQHGCRFFPSAAETTPTMNQGICVPMVRVVASKRSLFTRNEAPQTPRSLAQNRVLMH